MIVSHTFFVPFFHIYFPCRHVMHILVVSRHVVKICNNRYHLYTYNNSTSQSTYLFSRYPWNKTKKKFGKNTFIIIIYRRIIYSLTNKGAGPQGPYKQHTVLHLQPRCTIISSNGAKLYVAS